MNAHIKFYHVSLMLPCSHPTTVGLLVCACKIPNGYSECAPSSTNYKIILTFFWRNERCKIN